MNRRNIDSQRFYSWPYDDAISWMDKQREAILTGGNMALAIGTHEENVVTLGRHARATQILNKQELDAREILLRHVDRGGGATVHGPGQIVIYPMIHLCRLRISVPILTCILEQAMVKVLKNLNIYASCDRMRPGVYVGKKKIGAVGFHVHRGVVTHGASLNVSNDLSIFDLIQPCGIAGLQSTSIDELGSKCNLHAIADSMEANLLEALGRMEPRLLTC